MTCRAILAHPRCAYWLTDELVGVTSSRAFKWYAKPCISVFALDQSSTSHPIDGKWWQWQKWIKKPLEVDNRPSKNEKRQIIAAYAWICSCVILRDNMIFHHYRWTDKLISVNNYHLPMRKRIVQNYSPFKMRLDGRTGGWTDGCMEIPLCHEGHRPL